MVLRLNELKILKMILAELREIQADIKSAIEIAKNIKI